LSLAVHIRPVAGSVHVTAEEEPLSPITLVVGLGFGSAGLVDSMGVVDGVELLSGGADARTGFDTWTSSRAGCAIEEPTDWQLLG